MLYIIARSFIVRIRIFMSCIWSRQPLVAKNASVSCFRRRRKQLLNFTPGDLKEQKVAEFTVAVFQRRNSVTNTKK